MQLQLQKTPIFDCSSASGLPLCARYKHILSSIPELIICTPIALCPVDQDLWHKLLFVVSGAVKLPPSRRAVLHSVVILFPFRAIGRHVGHLILLVETVFFLGVVPITSILHFDVPNDVFVL